MLMIVCILPHHKNENEKPRSKCDIIAHFMIGDFWFALWRIRTRAGQNERR